MTAMPKKYQVKLPINANTNTASPVMAGYEEIIRELKKYSVTDVIKFSLPDGKNDVVRRMVRISKAPKDALIDRGVDVEDIADLMEVLDSNLPWAGHVTHSGASRQFRSKNCLSIASEVLREFDGYIYRLSAAVTDSQPATLGPALFELQKPSRMDRWYKISVNMEPSDLMTAEIILKAPIIPKALCDELFPLGYVLQGRCFVHPCGIPGANINVTLFGMIADAGV